MDNFFKELFEYNNHYNQQLIDLVTENYKKVSEKSIGILNHITNSHQIWNNRIIPNESAFGVWEIHQQALLKGIDQSNYQQSLRILDTLTLSIEVEYTNSKGHFKNSVRDILFHIINHSTYHRGQIASECRTVGIQPLVTDYIFYKR